jgi:hypothetical protein
MLILKLKINPFRFRRRFGAELAVISDPSPDKTRAKLKSSGKELILKYRRYVSKMTKFRHVLIICTFLTIFSTGCNSFKPIELQNDTRECSDFYTVLQYYSEVGKDSAFVGTVYNECKNSRNDLKQKKIEELCSQIYLEKTEYAKCIK